MSVYDLLKATDYSGYNAEFNGLLSDFLSNDNVPFEEFFQKCLEVDDQLRIYENYAFTINVESIANKKIGYRDVKKVPSGFTHAPYLLYWQHDGVAKALMINTDSHAESKGMYYAMTEQDNPLADVKSEILAVYLNEANQEDVLTYFNKLYEGKQTAGALQRKYDSQFLGTIEEMKEGCVTAAQQIFATTQEQLADMTNKKLKADLIYRTVCRIFFLKKGLYVRYMTSRQLLADRHSNNVVEQRAFAKAYCNEIAIVPFYTLWNPDAGERPTE